MHKAGEIMLGFRYAGSFAGGDMLHGENSAKDQDVIDNGCSPHACAMKPTNMTMNMYMLDLMYAPTDWLTLMVMPMWMSHEMTMGPLQGVMPDGHDDHGGMDMDGHGEHMHRIALARYRSAGAIPSSARRSAWPRVRATISTSAR